MKNRVGYGYNAAVYVLVMLGFVALLNYLSARHYKRYDFTASRRHTLSSQTVNILEALPYGIKVIAFVRDNPELRKTPESVLKQYEYRSEKFTWKFIDPDKKPSVAEKYEVTHYNTYIVEGKNGKKEKFSEQFSEQELTNALIKVISTKEKIVYFTRGHGEKDIRDKEPGGYDNIRIALKKENYKVKEIFLHAVKEIPSEAAVVIAAGPQRDFQEGELQKLEKFIYGGGKVLFMVDPFTLEGNLAFFEQFGIILRRDIVVDPVSKMFGGDNLIPTVATYEEHPVTKNFKIMTLFPLARSVEVMGVNAQELAKTLPNAWGETDRENLQNGIAEFTDGEDFPGPLSIMAVAETAPGEEGQKRGVLIVFGDSDFVANSYLQLQGNLDLFMNAVSWLAEEESLISIRPKIAEMDPVMFTKMQLYIIAGISILGLPALVLIAGIWISLRRRRS